MDFPVKILANTRGWENLRWNVIPLTKSNKEVVEIHYKTQVWTGLVLWDEQKEHIPIDSWSRLVQ